MKHVNSISGPDDISNEIRQRRNMFSNPMDPCFFFIFLFVCVLTIEVLIISHFITKLDVELDNSTLEQSIQ